MYINYDDEKELLSPKTKSNIELAARLAIGSELTICQGELDIGDEIEDGYFKNYYKDFDEPIELSVSVVTADEIKDINEEYRDIDKVTDVLSFPQYESSNDVFSELGYSFDGSNDCSEQLPQKNDSVYNDERNLMIGDVVLCYDKAIQQAEDFGTGIERELAYLCIHSIFHLLGYDHMDPDEKRAMRSREECVLHAIGLERDL